MWAHRKIGQKSESHEDGQTEFLCDLQGGMGLE